MDILDRQTPIIVSHETDHYTVKLQFHVKHLDNLWITDEQAADNL